MFIVVRLGSQIPDPLRCGKTMELKMVVGNYPLIDLV
jgi:hypothetical protein